VARRDELTVTLQGNENKNMSKKLFGYDGHAPLFCERKWGAILNLIRSHVDELDELTVMKALSHPDDDVMEAARLIEGYDMIFTKTQPQLQASIPLNSSHSQPMVAPISWKLRSTDIPFPIARWMTAADTSSGGK
jgi:hypothetical protein